MVWDQGTYGAAGAEDRAEGVKQLREGLEKGHLRFVLNGQKLKGEFSLIRIKRGAANSWLLVKKRDEWATTDDVTKDDRSITSGRNLEEIAGGVKKARPPRVRPAKPAAAKGKRGDVPHYSRGRKSLSAGVADPSLTHLDKVYWPEEGYTKGDLIAYYRRVAPVLLPYLRDRPESLHRHPNGINGKSFFQKDVSRQRPPDWVKTVALPNESSDKDVTYVLCQNEATLLYLVNLGCIELNPWNSRAGAPDKPDYLIIDLDPVEVPFARVVETASAVRKMLDRAGAASLCKTSGKRGLHIFVPLGAAYDHDQARQFAELIANLVHRQLPAITSVKRSPSLRQGRVYLDFLQNSRGQTAAAPYSVRPYAGATVSTPLQWREVKKGLDPAAYAMKTLPRRLDKIGDLWQPALGPGVDLSACLERAGKL